MPTVVGQVQRRGVDNNAASWATTSIGGMGCCGVGWLKWAALSASRVPPSPTWRDVEQGQAACWPPCSKERCRLAEQRPRGENLPLHKRHTNSSRPVGGSWSQTVAWRNSQWSDAYCAITPSQLGKRCRNQAGGSDARLSGEEVQSINQWHFPYAIDWYPTTRHSLWRTQTQTYSAGSMQEFWLEQSLRLLQQFSLYQVLVFSLTGFRTLASHPQTSLVSPLNDAPWFKPFRNHVSSAITSGWRNRAITTIVHL